MNTNVSYHTLRRLLGQLGIALPILIWVANGFQIEPSISDYYYTSSGTIFTGVLMAFGIFLFTYRGHEKNKLPQVKEWISDNQATNAAGFFAMMTAIVPTDFMGDGGSCPGNSPFTIYCHDDSVRNFIHLGSAATFLAILGWMSIHKFTLSKDKTYHSLYKVCGYIVWGTLIALLVYIKWEDWIGGKRPIKNGVFWGEVIALVTFGVAWLVKGKVSKMTIYQFLTPKENHKDNG